MSYTWGNAARTRCLDVEGYCLRITESAYLALVYHRVFGVGKEQVIWVDAICINQNDEVERMHQVQLMGTIYRNAQRVLVWLGEPNNPSPLSNPSHPSEEIPLHPQTQFPNFTPSQHTHFQTLLSNPWFSRVWIQQEVVLSRDLLLRYGFEEYTWQTFTEHVFSIEVAVLAQHFKKVGGLPIIEPDPPAGYMDNLAIYESVARIDSWKRWRSEGQGTRLEDVLYETSDCECSVVLDKVYGVLSIAPLPNGSLLLRPDYTLSLQQVETQLAISSVEQYQSLNILKYVAHLEHEISLPSWVPRWFSPKVRTKVSDADFPSVKGVRFMKSSKGKGGGLPDLLVVSGRVFGQFGFVSRDAMECPFWPPDYDLSRFDRLCLEVYISKGKEDDGCHRGDGPCEDFVNVLSNQGQSSTGTSTYSTPTNLSHLSKPHYTRRDFHTLDTKKLWGPKKLGIVDCSWVLLPPQARQGDWIARICGFPEDMFGLLRGCSDEDGKWYLFVGVCHVSPWDGVGKGWKDWEDGEEEIVLC